MKRRLQEARKNGPAEQVDGPFPPPEFFTNQGLEMGDRDMIWSPPGAFSGPERVPR